jgi:hypothetical protein
MDAFSQTFGSGRGRCVGERLDVGENPLVLVARLCVAAAVLGEERLAAFRPAPVPLTAALAALDAIGARPSGNKLLRACESHIGRHPGLDRQRHRLAISALCDAAYAQVGRPGLNAQEYAAGLGPVRALLDPCIV